MIDEMFLTGKWTCDGCEELAHPGMILVMIDLRNFLDRKPKELLEPLPKSPPIPGHLCRTCFETLTEGALRPFMLYSRDELISRLHGIASKRSKEG